MNLEEGTQDIPAELSLSAEGHVYFNRDMQPSERLLPAEFAKIQELFAKDTATGLLHLGLCDRLGEWGFATVSLCTNFNHARSGLEILRHDARDDFAHPSAIDLAVPPDQLLLYCLLDEHLITIDETAAALLSFA